MGSVNPGDAVEERRLAGAVGANQTEDLGALQREAHAVERTHPPERHRELPELEQRAAPRRGLAHRERHRPRRRRDGLRRNPRAQPLEPADEPPGRDDDHREQHRAVGDQVVLVEEAEPFRQMHEQERAEDRAGDAGTPADHRHRQHRHHDVELEHLGRDDPDGMDVKRAGDAGVDRREQERDEPQLPDVETEGHRGDVVLAHHGVGATEQAARELPCEERADRHQCPRQKRRAAARAAAPSRRARRPALRAGHSHRR